MPNYRRDALLAAVALATLVGFLIARETAEALWQPIPALTGALGALLIELGFLRYSLVELWERPSVQLGGLVVVVAGGVWTYEAVGPPAVGVLCWGLLFYFLILGTTILVGYNPLAVVE